MAPIALDPKYQSGNDSFAPAPVGNGNGHANDGQVHASARRTPDGGAFTVQADGTRYDEDGIRARYVDRGDTVTRTSAPVMIQRVPCALQSRKGGAFWSWSQGVADDCR